MLVVTKVPRKFVEDFDLVTKDWPEDERELARTTAREAFARGDNSPISTFAEAAKWTRTP